MDVKKALRSGAAGAALLAASAISAPAHAENSPHAPDPNAIVQRGNIVLSQKSLDLFGGAYIKDLSRVAGSKMVLLTDEDVRPSGSPELADLPSYERGDVLDGIIKPFQDAGHVPKNLDAKSKKLMETAFRDASSTHWNPGGVAYVSSKTFSKGLASDFGVLFAKEYKPDVVLGVAKWTGLHEARHQNPKNKHKNPLSEEIDADTAAFKQGGIPAQSIEIVKGLRHVAPILGGDVTGKPDVIHWTGPFLDGPKPTAERLQAFMDSAQPYQQAIDSQSVARDAFAQASFCGRDQAGGKALQEQMSNTTAATLQQDVAHVFDVLGGAYKTLGPDHPLATATPISKLAMNSVSADNYRDTNAASINKDLQTAIGQADQITDKMPDVREKKQKITDYIRTATP